MNIVLCCHIWWAECGFPNPNLPMMDPTIKATPPTRPTLLFSTTFSLPTTAPSPAGGFSNLLVDPYIVPIFWSLLPAAVDESKLSWPFLSPCRRFADKGDDGVTLIFFGGDDDDAPFCRSSVRRRRKSACLSLSANGDVSEFWWWLSMKHGVRDWRGIGDWRVIGDRLEFPDQSQSRSNSILAWWGMVEGIRDTYFSTVKQHIEWIFLKIIISENFVTIRRFLCCPRARYAQSII